MKGASGTEVNSRGGTSGIETILEPPTLVRKGTALAVLKRVNLLAESNALALDIGGSLAKILYLQPIERGSVEKRLCIDFLEPVATAHRSALSVEVPELGGTLHFFAFETRNIEECVKFIKEHWRPTNAERPNVIRATGGGAYKYCELFRAVGVELSTRDEMACTVAGLNFLLTHFDHEVYSVNISSSTQIGSPNPVVQRNYVDPLPDPYPYLLCHIGSGVSFIKVIGPNRFQRVSGTSLGGGTFWGLCRILTNCKTFDEVIELTKHGDNSRVDMLVGDIYGGAYEKLGLDANVIAASFGKVTMRKEPSPTWANFRRELRRFVVGTASLFIHLLIALPFLGNIFRWLGMERRAHGTLSNVYFSRHFRAEDVALSALRMVSYNVAQLAYLNAVIEGVPRIYFGGSFVREHPFTVSAISYAVDFWSKKKMQALFLVHDGYLGALGSFIGVDWTDSEQRVTEESTTSTCLSPPSRLNSELGVNCVSGRSHRRNRRKKSGDRSIFPPKTTSELSPSPLSVENETKQYLSDIPLPPIVDSTHEKREGWTQIARKTRTLNRS
ncbi:PaNtothenate Kinase [Cyanidiococcus yangmingshanensis]|uniref:PaNtothenate Kinase n=1 Tax=Cyanidiococcus yangmingshanensis TaxID=2690220 RepID=A0A7J7IQD0_9RHOD|nr:PaNtothenate Kinase [Cyanidiococcus yangmingshanensis]